MHVISKRPLVRFWKEHPAAEQPLTAWYREAKHATWQSPAEVQRMYGSADQVGNHRIVFNIGGNKYRLVVEFYYDTQTALVRFVGTHAELTGLTPER